MIKKFHRNLVKEVICTRFFAVIMFKNEQLLAFFKSADKISKKQGAAVPEVVDGR